ncbi:PREDICTED: uncharacterized protein LOC109352853 [Lupinus angustifolius]|uniref:uncharacterized protein LOC109352853 n=1 Tax=Lupinus angustifolius TaxID=3871 RepID=UPI00092FB53F|nr:PREDICTED: uncharacterized protein LOC109352853 [Lupinus angustifolius]
MEAPKKNVNVIVIKKANDHWAFLEDIEAPMWADLTLEAKANSVGEDMSDGWFSKSHPFHQWSARQLKSMFSHPGEGILTSEVDAQGLASPELPSSVSRSRGKHYISKKWEGINLNNLLDEQQGLSKRCFPAGSSFGQEMKPKSKLNVSRPKGLLSAKSGLTFECDVRGNAKSMTNSRNPAICSTSVDNKTSESNTRSTITSENTHQHQKYMEVSSKPCDQKSRNGSSDRNVSLRKSWFMKKTPRVQQQQKYMEVSSKPCDQKSGSSSVSSVSLRKSCVKEKASGLDIGGNSMKSRGHKSSSGKSTVGSSSNPGYEIESVSKYQRGKDVDKNKCKCANVSQRSSILVEGAKSSNQRGAKLRVEMVGGSMKSRGHGSSSGKSSVGSSSNPGYEVKFVSKHQREKITHGKDMVTMKLSDKNKCKPATISQTSSCRMESNVQCQPKHSMSLLPAKMNKADFYSTGAKEKLRTSKVNSLTGKGKENAARNVRVNKKCTEGVVPVGLKNHRTVECHHLKKVDTAGSSVLPILVL